MVSLNTLKAYEDENGNKVIYDGPEVPSVNIQFSGSGNTLDVGHYPRLGRLTIMFDCDNGTLRMAGNKFGSFAGFIRIGQDSVVDIGQNVTTTNACVISAVEGTSVTIGNDVMLASENEIRADDAHAIFDVTSGQRVNWSQDISIGNHVWLAKRAVLLGGASVGDGSVIGFGSLVNGTIPNNCVAAGTPARVVKQDIAWERPHLSLTRPFYKPNSGAVKKSAYWNITESPARTSPAAVVYESAGEHLSVAFPSESEAKQWADRWVPGAKVLRTVNRSSAEDMLLGSLRSEAEQRPDAS